MTNPALADARATLEAAVGTINEAQLGTATDRWKAMTAYNDALLGYLTVLEAEVGELDKAADARFKIFAAARLAAE